jgi:transposase
LVCLDEAGANLAMGRSHAWVLRGREHVEPRPMNWGDNLTLVGAVRRTGRVTLATKWQAMTSAIFLRWVRRALIPRLRPGDIVLLDNLKAHTQPGVRIALARAGVRLRYLPPYSHDFNPIESAWALVKKHIKTCAPRSRGRTAARRSRGPPRGPTPSLPPLVCPCWVRRLKYFPGLTVRGADGRGDAP